MKQLPNLFTLLNLFFGCCAIVFALQNGITVSFDPEKGSQLVILPEEMWFASFFIALAAVIDFLDGFVARLMGATSGMGQQLDSLADVVSFGVAPSLIVYQFLRLSYARQEEGLEISWIWLSPAFIIACAAAYRLAKFNLDAGQQYGFKGMPTPAIGLLVASFPLIYWHSDNDSIIQLMVNKWVWYAMVLLLTYLMVSSLPMLSLKFKDFSVKNNWSKFLLALIAIAAAVLLKWMAVPVVFIAYIAVSLSLKKRTT